jgi:tetratricopeptide (TPR) repeat protein
MLKDCEKVHSRLQYHMKNRRLKKRIRQLEKQLGLLLESKSKGASQDANEDLILTCRQTLISHYELADKFDSANEVRMGIAADFMESGQTQKAITEYHQVLKKSRNTANFVQAADTLSTIGTYFQVQGSYGAAIRFHTAALHSAKKSGKNNLVFRSLTDLGNVYAVMKNEDQSLACYELAVRQAGGESSDLRVSYVCTLIGSQFQKRDQLTCAYNWFKKAVKYASSAMKRESENARQDYATARYKLACLDFDLGNGPLAETGLSELLQFCSQHELLVSEALATIQLVRVRLKSGSAAGSLPLLQEQIDKLRKRPDLYPPECFMVFKLIGDHCKYFLKDTASAERFYALYIRQFQNSKKQIEDLVHFREIALPN